VIVRYSYYIMSINKTKNFDSLSIDYFEPLDIFDREKLRNSILDNYSSDEELRDKKLNIYEKTDTVSFYKRGIIIQTFSVSIGDNPMENYPIQWIKGVNAIRRYI